MSAGLLITGTDTGVGKTAVATGLLAVLRLRGVRVAALKPTETGWVGGPAEWPSDAASLARAAGLTLPREQVVPYVFTESLAPAVAARRAGVTIDRAVLDDAYTALRRDHQLVVVESAGGLAVPLAEELTFAGLASRWGLPVLVVARPGLGSINHTVLTVAYAQQFGLRVVGVVINGYPGVPSAAEVTNPEVIREMTRVPMLGILPYSAQVDVERLAALVTEHLNLDPILDLLKE